MKVGKQVSALLALLTPVTFLHAASFSSLSYGLLSDTRGVKDITPLHRAIFDCNARAVRMLMMDGDDESCCATYVFGETCFHTAAVKWPTILPVLIKKFSPTRNFIVQFMDFVTGLPMSDEDNRVAVIKNFLPHIPLETLEEPGLVRDITDCMINALLPDKNAIVAVVEIFGDRLKSSTEFVDCFGQLFRKLLIRNDYDVALSVLGVFLNKRMCVTSALFAKITVADFMRLPDDVLNQFMRIAPKQLAKGAMSVASNNPGSHPMCLPLFEAKFPRKWSGLLAVGFEYYDDSSDEEFEQTPLEAYKASIHVGEEVNPVFKVGPYDVSLLSFAAFCKNFGLLKAIAGQGVVPNSDELRMLIFRSRSEIRHFISTVPVERFTDAVVDSLLISTKCPFTNDAKMQILSQLLATEGSGTELISSFKASSDKVIDQIVSSNVPRLVNVVIIKSGSDNVYKYLKAAVQMNRVTTVRMILDNHSGKLPRSEFEFSDLLGSGQMDYWTFRTLVEGFDREFKDSQSSNLLTAIENHAGISDSLKEMAANYAAVRETGPYLLTIKDASSHSTNFFNNLKNHYAASFLNWLN